MSEKSITILGSTGSIGKSTVDIIRRHPDLYRVKALTGNQNVALLAEQAVLLKAELAVTANKEKYTDFLLIFRAVIITYIIGIYSLVFG